MASEKDRDADVSASESMTTSRRRFLLGASAASCVAVTGGVAGALSDRGQRTPGNTGAPDPGASHALLDHLRVGTPLHTSTVAAVHPIALGAIAVVMRRPDGSSFQLDVLERSERDGSIAQSARCSVFAVNGGMGSSVTSEPDGLTAMALARALVAAEQGGMPALNLLAHADRTRRYPAGTFRVAV